MLSVCFLQHGPCSWMEMHQYIGDLITSGNASKDPPDVLNATWGMAGGDTAAAAAAALGFKGVSLERLPHPPLAQGKTDAQEGRHIQPGSAQSKGESRHRREDFKTRRSVPSPARSDGVCRPKDLSLSMCLPDTTKQSSSSTSELETRTSGRLQGEDADRGSQSPEQSSETPPSRASSGSLSARPLLTALWSFPLLSLPALLPYMLTGLPPE
ncbi:hypothetical protein INR49_024247 [Caranx melampygus]|nr:hypothetical protein INR49_024247 [Caranx melampygus]